MISFSSMVSVPQLCQKVKHEKASLEQGGRCFCESSHLAFDKVSGLGYSSWQREVRMSDVKNRPHPSVTVDVVTVVRAGGGWRVLLIKRRNAPYVGRWAIPGGFVEPDESLEAAARRELCEETAVEPAHLEQLHAFGDPGRDPRGWTISIAHLAVLHSLEAREGQIQAGSDAAAAAWFDLDDPPPLAFDHADILAHARRRLAEQDVGK
jgi:8-oxo-dGTP diphosphatase